MLRYVTRERLNVTRIIQPNFVQPKKKTVQTCFLSNRFRRLKMLIQSVNNSAQDSSVIRGNIEAINTVNESSRPQIKAQTREVEPTPDEVKNATESVNEALKQTSRNLQFSVDQDTSITIVKLVDTETGDVIRQIPSKEMLEIAKSINQVRQGLFLKQEA